MGHAQQAVNELFQSLLLRTAEPDALEAYARMLQNSGSLQEVQDHLLASDEYQSFCLEGKMTCNQATAMVQKVAPCP